MKLQVHHRGLPEQPLIGTLADDAQGRVFFQYDTDWSTRGLELSPIHLPTSLRNPVQTPTSEFSPLFGLFDDSMPDWWGQRVMRRYFAEMDRPWNSVTVLEKLACQGAFAIGALAYEPDLRAAHYRDMITTEVTELVDSARQLMHGDASEILPALVRGALSPGGAQPKALISFNKDFTQAVVDGGEIPEDYSHWMIKFQLDADEPIGREEYAITRMAAAAGLRTPEVRLIETPDGGAHFLSQRFDRSLSEQLHFHSYAGITHTAVRELIDYADLMDLTRDLTRNEAEIEEMFRRAVFNIAIANDDDHSRNHGFLMNTVGEWTLSPAYDLTRSSYALGSGFRAAGVLGEFQGLSAESMKKLGQSQSMRRVDDALVLILDTVRRWPEFAAEAGLPDAHTAMIGSEMPASRW